MATFPRTLLRNPTTIADILAVVEQVMTDRLRADESARLADPDVDVCGAGC